MINYYDFMIDPITLEILKTLDYPTDIVSLVIFANNFTVCAKEVYTIITIYSYQSDYQCIFANAQTSIYVLPPPKIK